VFSCPVLRDLKRMEILFRLYFISETNSFHFYDKHNGRELFIISNNSH